MKKKTLSVTVVLALVALVSLAFVALPAFAAHPNVAQKPTATHPSVFAQEHPRGKASKTAVSIAAINTTCAGANTGNLVINVVEKVKNDVDSGQMGNWALDAFTRTIKVWNVGPDQWCASIPYTGTFAAQAGQLSPGHTSSTGGTLTGDEVGPFNGSAHILITGQLYVSDTTNWPLKGNVRGGAVVDYACDMAGNCPGYVSWASKYFNTSDANFAFNTDVWGWTYTGHDCCLPDAGKADGVWRNFYSGNSGDILDVD
jgi:hypothetical protein